jgi:diguanylate cyclase (GGDEF)-like protein/PAS domain S-box-containing protein
LIGGSLPSPVQLVVPICRKDGRSLARIQADSKLPTRSRIHADPVGVPVGASNMRVLSETSHFIQSRSGRGFLLYLTFCAVVSAAVGYQFYYSNVAWFKEHKSEEKIVALRLVDAFVTNYSALRSQLGPKAPVPASFRAHSIEDFNKSADASDDFRLRWVGRKGREIKTPPMDEQTAATIEAFATTSDPKPISEFLTVNNQELFRTYYPSLAKEQSCVDCHNELQPNLQWHLNDVMGAFVADVPASAFFNSIIVQGTGLSVALFVALAGVGFAIALSYFRQAREREAAAIEVSNARTFLDTVIEHIPAVVAVKDAKDLRYVLLNRTAEGVFGMSRDAMVGRTSADLFPRAQAELFSTRDREALQSRTLSDVGEQSIETPQLGTRILKTKKLPIVGSDGEPQYLLAVSEDITESKRAAERIVHLAHHDALTGLPNRSAFTEQLNATIDRHRSTAEPFALLCIDLDRFKEVNDVFGHFVGDALLQEVSRRMHAAAEGALLARLGGDEFTVITASGATPATIGALADRLLASVTNEFEIEGHHLRIGMSIGVAVFPNDGEDISTLLANGDAALYRAKAEGRGSVRFFEAEMDLRLRERRVLQQELHNAIENRELYLNYQPQAQIGGDVVGFEALLRWNSRAHGMVPPSTFIPLAEESGLIIPIGEWILREACREAASWRRPLHIAVNLSPVQFRHGDLVALVHSVLLETGLAPSRLELEITEGVLIDDFSRAVSILRRLKHLGVRIAMDDFGSGYSSLSYLQAFPFDKIKIDRTFIANLEHNPQSAAIVRAVIGLSRGLALPVVAEGVETQDQLAFLSNEACDEVQGYLIGHPRPIETYAELVGAADPGARQTAAG